MRRQLTVVFIAYPGESPIINCVVPAGDASYAFSNGGKDYIVFDGFTLTKRGDVVSNYA